MKNSKYIQRLLKEWKEHSKIIIAIDFDSTISYWNSIENQDDIYRCINLIRRIQDYTYNVIHTACKKERHEEILRHCKEVGIRVDSINSNPIELPYGSDGSKIYYNAQLCDRSGLLEAMDIIEEAFYMYQGHLQSLKPLLEIG